MIKIVWLKDHKYLYKSSNIDTLLMTNYKGPYYKKKTILSFSLMKIKFYFSLYTDENVGLLHEQVEG